MSGTPGAVATKIAHTKLAAVNKEATHYRGQHTAKCHAIQTLHALIMSVWDSSEMVIQIGAGRYGQKSYHNNMFHISRY